MCNNSEYGVRYEILNNYFAGDSKLVTLGE